MRITEIDESTQVLNTSVNGPIGEGQTPEEAVGIITAIFGKDPENYDWYFELFVVPIRAEGGMYPVTVGTMWGVAK